jgi:hypothetical protein
VPQFFKSNISFSVVPMKQLFTDLVKIVSPFDWFTQWIEIKSA